MAGVLWGNPHIMVLCQLNCNMGGYLLRSIESSTRRRLHELNCFLKWKGHHHPHGDSEAGVLKSSVRQGGWITFFFVTGTFAGSTIAASGWSGNLIVYLINEFNVKSIDAAQISNIVNGCISLFPVIGAIIADSFGCFSVISISLCISSLGIFLLCLNTFSSSLRPPPCQFGSTLCEGAIRSSVSDFIFWYHSCILGNRWYTIYNCNHGSKPAG
ncbi:unnamed protein product [Rhodiola kirilowii]